MGIVVQGAGQENEAQKNKDTRNARAAAAKRLAEQKAAEAAEAARQARIKEIESQIKFLELEIKELKERKEQYTIMKNQIELAQSYLDSTNNKILTAEDGLSVALIGQKGEEGKRKMDSTRLDVGSIYQRLSAVLPEASKKIKELEESINDIQTRVRQLYASLRYI